MKRERLFATALVLVSLLYSWGARGLPLGRDEPGPSFFPTLLGVMLFVLAVITLVQRHPNIARKSDSRSWLVIGLTVLYVLVVAALGFVVTTALYSAGVALVLGQRRWHVVAIGLVATASMYVIFELGLGVTSP